MFTAHSIEFLEYGLASFRHKIPIAMIFFGYLRRRCSSERMQRHQHNTHCNTLHISIAMPRHQHCTHCNTLYIFLLPFPGLIFNGVILDVLDTFMHRSIDLVHSFICGRLMAGICTAGCPLWHHSSWHWTTCSVDRAFAQECVRPVLTISVYDFTLWLSYSVKVEIWALASFLLIEQRPCPSYRREYTSWFRRLDLQRASLSWSENVSGGGLEPLILGSMGKNVITKRSCHVKAFLAYSAYE